MHNKFLMWKSNHQKNIELTVKKTANMSLGCESYLQNLLKFIMDFFQKAKEETVLRWKILIKKDILDTMYIL